MRINKKILTLLLIGLVCLTFLVVAPTVAHAQDNAPAPTTYNFIENAILAVLSAIQGFIAKLTSGTAGAIKWMIDFGTTVMTFPVVKSGFEVTLSFVNLLFVMALIVIAFQMILGLDGHHTKSTLGKIILAGLLINFSLLIAGFLLDFSNVFTNFFMHDISPTVLTGAFNPERFGKAIFGPGFIAAIMSSIFAIFMQGLILVTMTAVFVMATIRNVVVAGLLLLMPLTWGMWIFPGMHEHHSDWWKNFIKYGMTYLPTITFFLWLAIATAGNTQYWDKATKTVEAGFMGDILGSVIQLVLIVGIIIFGLKTTEAAGGIGANLGMTLAKKAGGGLGKFGLFAGKGVLNQRVWPGGDKSLRGLGKGAAGLASRVISGTYLQLIPGFKGLANKAAGASHYDHDIEEFMKNNYANFGYEQMRDTITTSQTAEAAKLKRLSQLGKTSDFINDPKGGMKSMESMIQASAHMNHMHGEDAMDIEEVKKAVEAAPALAKSFGRTIAQQIGRMSSAQIAALHHSNFTIKTAEGRELIAAVGNNAAGVKALMTNGSDLAKDAFKDGMKALNSGAALPALPGTAGPTPPLLTGTILTNRNAIATEDIEIKRLISIGAQSTNHINHQDLNDAKERRQNAIAAIQASVDTMRTTGNPEKAARIAGVISGEAVMRQVVARDTGNVINP